MKNDQYTILGTINGDTNYEDTTQTALTVMRHDFDQPDVSLVNESVKQWYMPHSDLTPIDSQTEEFRRITISLNLEEKKITSMEKIDNITWSVQYSKAKTQLNDSQGFTANEEELFYSCPPHIGHDILQHGFDLNMHCIHGKLYDIQLRRSCDYSRCETRRWLLFFIGTNALRAKSRYLYIEPVP